MERQAQNTEDKFALGDDEIFSAINDESNLWTETIQGKTAWVIGPDWGKPYGNLHKFVKQVLRSNEPFYRPDLDRRDRPIFKETELSVQFRRLNAYMALYRPDCSFSPEITLFFEVVEALDLWHERFTFPGAWALMANKKQAESCNDLVDMIRERGRTQAFRNLVKAKQEKSTRNFTSAKRYVKALFAYRSRLMVVRIDFYPNTQSGEAVTIEQTRQDLFRFFRNRRSNTTLFGAMLGYIWKLEYGGSGRGFHFHCMFFFDGSKVEKDAFWSDRLGQYWVDVVTKGKGDFHNCNKDKRKYKRLGIGMIHRGDVEKRQNLEGAIEYLTKKDYCFKPEMDGGRVFGKGSKPPVNRTGVGRPPVKHPVELLRSGGNRQSCQ